MTLRKGDIPPKWTAPCAKWGKVGEGIHDLGTSQSSRVEAAAEFRQGLIHTGNRFYPFGQAWGCSQIIVFNMFFRVVDGFRFLVPQTMLALERFLIPL